MQTITLEGYGQAVSRLLELAKHDTSGGRAAAQVLLGTYNGYEFHCDLTDLCLLDGADLAAAIAIIQGRATLGHEPHELVRGGGTTFEQVWQRWEQLHVAKRYAQHYPENHDDGPSLFEVSHYSARGRELVRHLHDGTESLVCPCRDEAQAIELAQNLSANLEPRRRQFSQPGSTRSPAGMDASRPDCAACGMPDWQLEHLEDEGTYYCTACGHRTPDDLEPNEWGDDVPY